MNIKNNDKIELTYSVETDSFYYIDGSGKLQVFPTGTASLGYSEYVALVTQTLSFAPVVTVVSNTLSGTPVMTLSATGTISITLDSAFTEDKTTISVTAGGDLTSDYYVNTNLVSTSVLKFTTVDGATDTPTDGRMINGIVMIRVYD